MPRPFPTHPDPEHFRKQAKQLLRDLRAGQPDATARVRRSHPRLEGPADPTTRISLHDAQLVVAREFGYASWRRLQDAVQRAGRRDDAPVRALVTGGAGFIGSHLAETLIAHGQHVTVLDDLSTGSGANVKHLAGDPFELIVGDVCDDDFVDRLVAGADVVYHLAAAIGYRESDSPLRLWRTNGLGTQVVVESCSRHRRRLVMASTSAVYGKTHDRQSLAEDADLILGEQGQPGWDYAISKVANEQLIRAHIDQHGLSATIVRPFNVVGPRSQVAVVPAFLAQAQTRQPVTIHGDGSSTRCFTDVRDVSEAMVRLADCPDATGQAVNLGSRQETSLDALAGLITSVTHSDSPVEKIPYEDLPFGGYQRSIPSKTPNLSKARQLIGYSPVHTLEECLQEMVALDEGGVP